MTALTPLTALLLAIASLIAATPTAARAAEQASQTGNIIDNRVTTVSINPATSIATIAGTVQCSAPTQLEVYGAVRQSHGTLTRLAESFGGTLVACGTTPTAYTVT